MRDYGVPGQLGLEKSPEEYVAKLVEVFREVKRVLKPQGTVFLNLGDSYMSLGENRHKGWKDPKNIARGLDVSEPQGLKHKTIKPKDLVGIPWRVAFALQADGWWLRQDMIWSKPAPMPESVNGSRWERHRIKIIKNGKKEWIDCPGCSICLPNDKLVLRISAGRCTKSHEYIFLLTKSDSYYFDNEAIKEEATGYDGRNDTKYKGGQKDMSGGAHERWHYKNLQEDGQQPNTMHLKRLVGKEYLSPVRNKRSVWTVNTQAFKESHYATFPEALIVPMIKAGTSEKGVCPECGKAWVRIVKKSGGTTGQSWHDHCNDIEKGMNQCKKVGGLKDENGKEYSVQTLGWKPQCTCRKEPVPAIVLDPFIGAGTVGLVAKKLLRNYVGIELNPNYVYMAEKRIHNGAGLL